MSSQVTRNVFVLLVLSAREGTVLDNDNRF